MAERLRAAEQDERTDQGKGTEQGEGIEQERTEQSEQTSQEAKENAEQGKRRAGRELGAKILTGVGFQDRQKEIVESSLEKEKARGEKLSGGNMMRRNLAYLGRLERMIDKHGNALEKKLWDASVEKLIVEPEEIEESYWKSQERILRDEGQGRKLSDYEKELLTEEIQKRQRESLKSWANYLGDERAPYPLWFKVYAWDGMSKMGVFDKEEKEFKKRNEHTVAPYPKLNAAVLAKVYGAVDDFYKYKNNKDKTEGKSTAEERDQKLDALVQSGNFNKLYSKFLLEQKVIPKTPERTEDVHGEWVEYLPGQEEELANAAEGTPWCVADPGTGRNYLEHGVYSLENNDWADDYDEEGNGENGAKFILFHLEDPETGSLAENACASIRLGTDGRVAEISGLNEGQALEDSLVPIVEEKVKTLPGGEEFLEAFADKKKLIALDRKMEAGEELTRGELEFVFEKNRPIKTLDTYNRDGDPRVQELRNYFLSHIEEYSADDVRSVALYTGGKNIDKNFDYFIEIGVDPAELVKAMNDAEAVYNHIDRLIELKVDVNDLTRSLGGYSATICDMLIKKGVDHQILLENMGEISVDDNFDKLLGLGIDPELILKNMDPMYISQHGDQLIERGVDVNKIAEAMDGADVSFCFEWLRQQGADVDVLVSLMYDEAIEWRFDQLCELGANLNIMVKRLGPRGVHKLFERLVEYVPDQLDLEVLLDNTYLEDLQEYFDRLVELGADSKKLEQKISEIKKELEDD